VIRSAHAFADGAVVLGPDCADPYSPKAVRASMGSVFARPPARGDAPEGNSIGLDPSAEMAMDEVELSAPVVLCLGGERGGLPAGSGTRVRIPMRDSGPDSLNVAMAATTALYEARTRMRGHA
jgi:RNA methyltransferase, TrmH family